MGLLRPFPRPALSPGFPLCSPTDVLISPPPPSTSRQPSCPEIPPKPPTPKPWKWTCHLCGDSYRLGVTRRCLKDGHYFCAGQPAAGSSTSKRKSKKRRFCESEFDYHGWKAMDQWCRQVKAARQGTTAPAREPDPPSPRTMGIRNCWERCTFPTACRNSGPWGGPLSPLSEDGGDIPPEGEPKRRKVEKR
ncbi:hypothetical protein VTN00DRAFT_4836 [Thermoascus crustaceus]|uniref:uncharacterized protein n=1 Tax=Thermoascus crustaceus TaxID=5088 RepID=UPI0037422CF5